jgi:DedD protein
MANQAITDEELQLRRRARRRLIGAVVLVTALVIALPMVLDGEPKPSGQDIAINIPSQSSNDFSSRIVPAEPASDSRESATPPKSESSPDSRPDPAAPAPSQPAGRASAREHESDQTSRETADAGAKSNETKAQETAAKAESGAFVVQLGAFASLKNAKQRQAELSRQGISFYTETVKGPAGERIRVRAGPYPTREEAEKVNARLKAAGIQDGVVAEKK